MKAKLRYDVDGKVFRTVRAYPSHGYADGPLARGFLRLIPKNGGAVVARDESGSPYVVYVDSAGRPHGGPVWMSPAQFKRAMSYQYMPPPEFLTEWRDVLGAKLPAEGDAPHAYAYRVARDRASGSGVADLVMQYQYAPGDQWKPLGYEPRREVVAHYLGTPRAGSAKKRARKKTASGSGTAAAIALEHKRIAKLKGK